MNEKKNIMFTLLSTVRFHPAQHPEIKYIKTIRFFFTWCNKNKPISVHGIQVTAMPKRMSEFHTYKLFDAPSSSSSSSVNWNVEKWVHMVFVCFYSIDFIHFAHFTAFIHISMEIDYIRIIGDYYSINQKSCFIWKSLN